MTDYSVSLNVIRPHPAQHWEKIYDYRYRNPALRFRGEELLGRDDHLEMFNLLEQKGCSRCGARYIVQEYINIKTCGGCGTVFALFRTPLTHLGDPSDPRHRYYHTLVDLLARDVTEGWYQLALDDGDVELAENSREMEEAY